MVGNASCMEYFPGGPLLGAPFAHTGVLRVRKSSPKFSCIKFFQIRDVPTQIRDIPATPCLKQQKKATCIKFLSGIFRRVGSECPRNIPPKNFMFRLFFSDLSIFCLDQSTKKRRITEGFPGSDPVLMTTGTVWTIYSPSSPARQNKTV